MKRSEGSFENFYYQNYRESVSFLYDYWNIKDFYENSYKNYYRLYNNLDSPAMASIDWPVVYEDLLSRGRATERLPGFFWLETLLLNRFRELSLVEAVDQFYMNSKYQNF